MVQDFLARNQRLALELAEKFVQANGDWGNWLKSQPLTVEYDPDTDYLWIQFGAQGVTVAVAHHEGLVLLAEADSYRFCALECPFFLENFAKGVYKKFKWLEPLTDNVKKGHHYIYIPPAYEQQEVHDGLRELVSARF